MNFTPTAEQINAVELSHHLSKLKLSALASSAKTSTCVLIAEANPCPSLYLAFNKTMAEDAAGRFPAWVKVRTTHSLAYKVFGRKYSHKLSRPAGTYQNVGWTGSEVARLLHIPSMVIRSTGEIITSNSIGACVIATVSNFQHSVDKELCSKHVPFVAIPPKKQSRDDFPNPYDKNSNWTGLLKEEQNLLYVALTRAKKVLVKNNTIEEILCYYEDKNFAESLMIGNASMVQYISCMQADTLDRAIDIETVKLGGRMLDDMDLFCEGDNLHPYDPHWQNMDMEFSGLPQ